MLGQAALQAVQPAINAVVKIQRLAASMAHGVRGGVSSLVNGGSGGAGFLSGFAGAGVGGIGQDYYLDVVMGATIGGTVSVVAGGKFVNGAVTAAFAVVTAHAASSLKIRGNKEFVKETKSALRAIRKDPTGKILLEGLENAKTETTIMQTLGGNKWSFGNILARNANGSVVHWNPDRLLGGVDMFGFRIRDPFIGLGHELGHAFDWVYGSPSFIRTAPIPFTTPSYERTSIFFEEALRSTSGHFKRGHYFK